MSELSDHPNVGSHPPQDGKTALVLDPSFKDFLSPDEQSRYGLQVRQKGDKLEAYFHAGGKDNVVASEKVGSHATNVAASLDLKLHQQMTDLKQKYKVDFAAPKELVNQQRTENRDCMVSYGAMVYAKQPTFADLFATRLALSHSMPSQLSSDGTSGVKFYFLDQRIDTQPVYGNKYTLAEYTNDKDRRIAVYVTPDGEKLPTTATDNVSPEGRNLTYVLEHELTHNSQRNNWSTTLSPPEAVAQSIGWQTSIPFGAAFLQEHGGPVLKGKSGAAYFQIPAQCGAESAWLGIKNNHWLADGGKLTSDEGKAAHLTNDQVRADASVRPISYYFPNATEMFSEGLTKFRTDENSRRQLFIQSPQLYSTVSKYDSAEIARFYGTDSNGKSKYLRAPDGLIVARTSQAIGQLNAFDRSMKLAP